VNELSQDAVGGRSKTYSYSALRRSMGSMRRAWPSAGKARACSGASTGRLPRSRL